MINSLTKYLLLFGGTILWATLTPTAWAAGKDQSSSCRSCHDLLDAPPTGISTSHSQWDCQECHRHALSPEFHKKGLGLADLQKRQASIVAAGIRLSEEQVLALAKQCQSCHTAEFTPWSASRHHFTYGQSFLNEKHNRMEPPIDDCLRCHAMFFKGAIGDLLTPLDRVGPWKMKSAKLARHDSIPCLSCHRVHPEESAPTPLPQYAALRPPPEKGPASVGFYDRREARFFALNDLPHPQVHDGQGSVKISSDPRLRNCYQCHAPNAAHRTGTSDDKTPRGVHAGLSCLDCHGVHDLSARNSCAACHPAISHCKLDVTRMDTTNKDPASKHNIHNVACTDCHPTK
jgi:hypothetical protein